MSLELDHQLTDVAAIRRYIFAGKSVFTLQSKKTNKHFTFKCRFFKETEESPLNQKIWWIDTLGQGNQFNYTARFKNGQISIKKGLKIDPIICKTLEWFMPKIWVAQETLLKDLNFFHAGQCGRCKRPLTTPESVKAGIGPECIKHIYGEFL